jgi:PAS domain S-box-containing protein
VIETDAINASIDRARHVLLVVDDNPATRYSTSRVLQKAGFRTAEAGSGQEALDRVREGVAGMVLDVHLPDISGFDVCRQLRASPATSTLPIVHLSAAFTRDEDRVQGLDAGADAYLVHPVEPAFLVATLQALVRARTAEEELRRSEQRFRAVYDHAPSGIVLLDRGGFIVDANPAMCTLLGLDLAELVGSRLADLAAPDSREVAHLQSTGDDAGPQAWRGQFALVNKAGRRVPLEWSMAPSGCSWRRSGATCWSASRPPVPPPNATAAPRTTSSPCCRTNCAPRSTPSSAGSAC